MAFTAFVPHLEPMRFPSEDGTKVYEVPTPGIADGWRLRLSLDPTSDVELDGVEQEQLLLGKALDELRADNVSQEYANRLVLAAWVNFTHGRREAEITWETGTDPKARQAMLDAQAPTDSPTTAEESATPPASTSSTKTSRPSSTRSKSGTAPKRPGTTS